MSKRWLITGVSTGFGRILAREAVKRGHRVVGTVRQPGQIGELAAEGVPAILLDVRDAEKTPQAVAEAIEVLGGLDVLVNNAGYGLMGAIEALDEDAIRDVMETNFFGALRVTRAVLPRLRGQGSGVIVNISSMAGRVGMGAAGAYCASKFALEGLSDALAEELAPFGVKLLIVEPGGFRTDFSGRSVRTPSQRIDAYAGTRAGEVVSALERFHGNEIGDPVKAVEAIIEAVESENVPLRLVLGADAVAAIESRLEVVRQEMTQWKAVALATAFDS